MAAMYELTGADLDAVSAGHSLIDVDIHDVNVCVGVDANVITRNSQATTNC